jgi:predicted ATP-grasp superfamily ATP-dependent carboligase
VSAPRVGVVGASARAAVHSLARAGFTAWAVDLFADRDLTRVAPCAVCPPDSYPDAIPGLAAQFPPGPVLYTGGLENHPHVIAELAATRELWGNPPDVLERVRDPHRLFPALARCGFEVPAVVPPGEPCPTTGRWLRKPLHSAGGLAIRAAKPGEPPSLHHYFQEFIGGKPMSVVYGGTTLLDVSEQLIGEPWLHAKPFGYCGSIGPAEMPCALLGTRIKALPEIALPALGNIDFILREGCEVPVELNPRYPASVEVLEHAIGISFITLQMDSPRSSDRSVVGKAVYYAPHTITFPASGPWDADLAGEFDPWRLPGFADIPEPGAIVEAGWPVLTVFAAGSSPAACRERLQSRAAELDHLFGEATS